MEKFKSILKRTLATVLVVVMLICAAPLDGFVGLEFNFDNPFKMIAGAFDEDEIVYGTDEGITRAEWLHNLAVVFEMTVEDEIYPDNYFSDLEETHEYYYDVLLNVNFGVVDVEAGEEVEPDGLVTRSFASHTLNFCLGYQLEDESYTFNDFADCEYPADAQIAVNRGWLELIDSNFCPENAVADDEVKKMIDDTKNILGLSEIDTDYDSEFSFSSEVIEIEDGTEIEINENRITINDSPEEISTGDIFAVYKSGIPLVYKAEAVSISGELTVITATYIEDAEGEYILEADAQGEADLEDVVITPAEGVDVYLNYEEPQVSLFAFGRGDGKKKIANISAKGSVSLGPLGCSASYSVELKAPTIKYSYNIGKGSAQITFECNIEKKFSLESDIIEGGGYEKEILIFNLGVPGVGGLDVYLSFDISGSVSVVAKSNCKVGASYNTKDNFRTIKNFSSSTFSFHAEISGSAGVIVKLGVTQLPLVNAFIYAEAGGTAKAEADVYSSGTPKSCVEFAAYVYANYGATFKLKAGIFSFESKAEEKVWDSKSSPARIVKHYEDNKPVTKCTRGDSGSAGSGGSGSSGGSSGKNNYYTKSDSVYSGGWSEGDNSYGFNKSGERVQLFEYSLDSEGNATITSYKGNATVVNIPETIDGYTVVTIGRNSFKNNTNIRTVNIPDSVTSIGDSAFYDCSNLTRIEIPDDVTSIGDSAFRHCLSLTSIEIPEGVTSIGSTTFEECLSLTSIEIPEGLTSIGDFAFHNCYSLTSIEIPDSVTSIGYWAFDLTGYSKNEDNWENGVLYIGNHLIEASITLTGHYTIKASTKTIADYAFSNCTSLTSIIIPDGACIGKWAFNGCQSLKSIEIPDSVTSIGNSAFNGTGYFENEANWENGALYIGNHLIEVFESLAGHYTIKASTKTIADYAFYNCSDLTIIEIPDSVTNIGDFAFCFCSSLTSITIPDSVTSIGNYTFEGCMSLASICIPENIISIGNSMFSHCESLTGITIPDSVTSIGDHAFSYCTSLTSITIPDSVTIIGDYVFSHCTSLTSITIPNGVKSVGGYAFDGCKSLASITIPDSVINIGEWAFSFCESLTDIEISDSVTSIGFCSFYHCRSLTNITIPDSITSIGYSAFHYCTSLTSIEIPDSVTSIGHSAFYHCTSLISITIPNGVRSIGESTFEGCNNLAKITIGNGVMSIGEKAFQSCKSLKNITMSDSITSIGDWAFVECFDLTDVYYGGSEERWNSIQIGSGNTCLTILPIIHFNSNGPDDIPEHTHSFSEAITTPSTCTTNGVKTFTCFCGDGYTEAITATGHSETTLNAVPATCTKTGLTEGKKCTVCGTITAKQQTVAKLDHTSDNGTITKSATCVASGTKVYKCTVCNTTLKTETLSATGKHNSNITIPAVAATYTSTGLTAGKKCSVCNAVTVKQTTVAKLTLGKVSGLKAKTVKVAKSSEITLSWNKIGDGVKYEVYQQNGKKWKKVKTTTKTSYTVKKLKSNKSYKFRVRAVVDDIKGSYSSTLTVKTVPAKTTLTLKAGKKQLTASWKSVSSISGYEVQYSTSKSMKNAKTVKVKKDSKKTTIKKLKKGKKYYVRVRTYKTVDGKKIYSSWSTVKNVKVK